MKQSMSVRPTEPDETDLRAAEWVVRLDGGPLDADHRAALRAWLEEDADHRAAFEEASATWRQMAGLKQEPGPLRAMVPGTRAARTRKVAGLGAVVALVVMAAAGITYNQFGNPMLILTSDYRTAPGEVRLVQLPDGSTAELGPSSALALDYTTQERRVRLLAGEAFFTATPRAGAEERPFITQAAGGETRALGTQFVVDVHHEGARVLAVEHQIEVSLGTSSAVILSPGEEVGYERDGGLTQVQTRDLAQATAWRRGMLVFDDVPLADVVDTLNRYRRGRIVIMDSALAQRRVSGVFATSGLADAIHTITDELGVRARSIYPFLTVLY